MLFFFFQAEDGIRDDLVTGVQTCALPIFFATFIPSYLVYKKILPEPLITSVTDFTKGTNFLYLFIAAVIVGSILGMDRTVLIKGFVKIFIPIAAGTVPPPRGGLAPGQRLRPGPH